MNLLWLIIVTGFAGGVLKIAGGLLYGSNTLFVDALTSIANMISLLIVLWFRRITSIPPDSDHHFGHERFEYVGILPIIIAYGFVAGIGVARLYYVREYTVGIGSFYLALAATLLYSIAVVYSRKTSPSLRAYGVFTASELLEGIVGIIASLGGALYSYLIDYGGAVLLTSYIFYEIYEEGVRLVALMADVAPPLSVYEEVLKIAGSKGFTVKSLRLRTIVPGRYHGDMVIDSRGKPSPGSLAELKKELAVKGIDVCIDTYALR